MLAFLAILALAFTSQSRAFAPAGRAARMTQLRMQGDGLKIDMRGKTVFVAGVADSTGYGWAIAKACAEAGAKIVLGTWPPVLPIFQMGIERGQFEADQKLSDGSTMKIEKVRHMKTSRIRSVSSLPCLPEQSPWRERSSMLPSFWISLTLTHSHTTPDLPFGRDI